MNPVKDLETEVSLLNRVEGIVNALASEEQPASDSHVIDSESGLVPNQFRRRKHPDTVVPEY